MKTLTFILHGVGYGHCDCEDGVRAGRRPVEVRRSYGAMFRSSPIVMLDSCYIGGCMPLTRRFSRSLRRKPPAERSDLPRTLLQLRFLERGVWGPDTEGIRHGRTLSSIS